MKIKNKQVYTNSNCIKGINKPNVFKTPDSLGEKNIEIRI